MAQRARNSVYNEGPSVALPVFNLTNKNFNKFDQSQDHHDRLPPKGVPYHPSLPSSTGFNHKSTLVDAPIEYYGCGGRRRPKSSWNTGTPKPRPLAEASILHEASPRFQSMRILSTPKDPSIEELPLDWRDDTHSSLSNRKRQGLRSDAYHTASARPLSFNANAFLDSSINFSRTFSQGPPLTRGLSQDLPPKKGFSQEFPGKIKPPARHQSPSSSKSKAGFKFLSAKLVAEKLVKALTKDKGSQGETAGKVDSSQVQKGKRNVVNNTKFEALRPDQSIDLQTDGHSNRFAAHVSDVDGGNGYLDCPSRGSIDYECRELDTQNGKLPSHEMWLATLHSQMLDPASEQNSSYNVVDPLEARARAFEEQAAMFGSGNDLPDVLMRTFIDDGDTEFQTLEIHIDVLRTEFRKHMDDKRDMALKMAATLRARLSERARFEEMLEKARADMEGNVRALERERVETKSRLQEDMEESETQWASKYEKVRSKEKRLSERLKEILEEKVELHKEVSSLTTKKNALVEEVQGYKESMEILKERVDESTREAEKLRKVVEDSGIRLSFRDLEGPVDNVLEGSMGKLAEEEISTLARRYKHKEKEVLEKQKVVGRLQKLCKEQEKTIAGLRVALGEQANNAQMGKGEFIVKLQRELVRLTGIEQGLRREVDACKGEALAAKRENAMLIEKLGSIMKRLGGPILRTSEANKNLELAQRAMKPASDASNQDADSGFAMRVEEVHDEREAELDSNNNSLAIVVLGHPPPAPCNTLDDANEHNARLECHVRDLISSGIGAHCKEGEELEKLRGEAQNLIQSKTRLQEEASNLHDALSLTNRRVRELEEQLVNKEEELGGIYKELERVREQRDKVQEESNFMEREAIELSAQVERLSRKVERLDEDVMVKDGQLSILRGALHDTSE